MSRLRLKAVAVVYLRLLNSRSPEQSGDRSFLGLEMPHNVPPEFQKLTAADIAAALIDPAGNNPVIQELTRLRNAYENERARLARQGKDPDSIFQRPAGCALEEFARAIAAGKD